MNEEKQAEITPRSWIVDGWNGTEYDLAFTQHWTAGGRERGENGETQSNIKSVFDKLSISSPIFTREHAF
jgi:hypothetical protein